MKKFISFVLAMILLIIPCAVNANTETLYEALNDVVHSAQVHTDFSIQLNRPLEFLRVLEEEDPGAMDPVDIKMLTESVMDLTQSADASYYMSEDRKIIQMSAVTEMNLPLAINDSLKTEIWAKTGFWMNMNVEDVNKPIYQMIYKVPFSSEYVVLDLDEYWDSPSEFMQNMEFLVSQDVMKEYVKTTYDILLKHAKVTEVYRNKKYELVIDDAAFKAIIKDSVDALMEQFDILTLSDEDRAEYENVMAQLASIPVIGTDGYRIVVELNNGHVEKTTSSMHLQFNIYDLAQKITGEAPETYNREDWWLDFTLTEASASSSINQITSVEIPDVEPQEDDDYYYYPSYYNRYTIETVGTADIETERYFALPLRDVMYGLGIETSEYSIADGLITVTPAAKSLSFEKATLEVGSDKINIDGAEFVLSSSLYADEAGLIYMPLDAAESLTDGEMTFVDHEFVDDECTKTSVHIEKVLEEETEEYENETEYFSTYVYVGSNGKPVFENNTLYIPLRPVMEKFLIQDENIVWNNGVTTVTDDEIKEFSKLQLTANSNEVWINDEQHVLGAPVIIRNDSMYFPVELLTLMQCEMRYVEYYYISDRTSISFYRNAYDVDYDIDEDYYLSYQKNNMLNVYYEGAPVISDGSYYMPLWPLMGELKVSGDDILEEENSVYITSEKPITGFSTMLITENNVTKDDIQYVLEKPMIKANDVFYVPSEFVTDVLDGTMLEVSKYYNEDYESYVFRISVPNPLYNPEN